MALMSIPVTISMLSESIVRNDINIYPEVRIEFNNKIVFGPQEIICNKSPFSTSFNVEFDDDIVEPQCLEVHYHTEDSHNMQWNEHDNKQDRFGVQITDLELNDISMDELVLSHGIIEAKLSLEADYDTDGFINGFIIPASLEKELHLRPEINNEEISRYWWVTNGDYLHGSNVSYKFNFKSPLYAWLLETLLD